MEKSDLKPCPFCGGEASPNGVYRRSHSPDCRWLDGTECLEAFFCNCMSCGAHNGGSCAGGFQTREKAIEHWNQRVQMPIAEPTQKEAKQADADYYGHPLTELGMLYALRQFVARRNAPPVDPKREAIEKALKSSIKYTGGSIGYSVEQVTDAVLAALKEVEEVKG